MDARRGRDEQIRPTTSGLDGDDTLDIKIVIAAQVLGMAAATAFVMALTVAFVALIGLTA